MNVTTKIVWDMTTGTVLAHEYFAYSGTWELAKGDGAAKDQLKLQNSLVQNQLASQKALSDKLNAAFDKYLTGEGQGFSPEQVATLNSQFMNENSRNFNSAGQQLKSALLSRGSGGGDLPVGGDYVRGISELEGLRGASQAGGLANIRLQNLQQGLMNRFNAGSVMQGQSAQLGQNIGTFTGGANNALNQYVYAANQGFGNAFTSGFGRAFGGGLGGGLSSGITGGLGTALGKIPGLGSGG